MSVLHFNSLRYLVFLKVLQCNTTGCSVDTVHTGMLDLQFPYSVILLSGRNELKRGCDPGQKLHKFSQILVLLMRSGSTCFEGS